MTPFLLLLPLQAGRPSPRSPICSIQAALTEAQVELLGAIASATERVAPLACPPPRGSASRIPGGRPRGPCSERTACCATAGAAPGTACSRRLPTLGLLSSCAPRDPARHRPLRAPAVPACAGDRCRRRRGDPRGSHPGPRGPAGDPDPGQLRLRPRRGAPRDHGDAAEVALEPLLQAACAVPVCTGRPPYATASLANLLNAGASSTASEAPMQAFLLAVQTELGRVLLGSRWPQCLRPRGRVHPRPRRDDRYAAQATRTYDAPNLVVDRAGNDVYAFMEEPVAAARCGVSVLVDWAGNDTYVAAATVSVPLALGVGVPVDPAGDDRYQGEACPVRLLFGVGLCLDRAGDDRMGGAAVLAVWGRARGSSSTGAGPTSALPIGVFPTRHGTEGVPRLLHGNGSGAAHARLELPQRAGGWCLRMAGGRRLGGRGVRLRDGLLLRGGHRAGPGGRRRRARQPLRGGDVERTSASGSCSTMPGTIAGAASATVGLAGNWDLTSPSSRIARGTITTQGGICPAAAPSPHWPGSRTRQASIRTSAVAGWPFGRGASSTWAAVPRAWPSSSTRAGRRTSIRRDRSRDRGRHHAPAPPRGGERGADGGQRRGPVRRPLTRRLRRASRSCRGRPSPGRRSRGSASRGA